MEEHIIKITDLNEALARIPSETEHRVICISNLNTSNGTIRIMTEHKNSPERESLEDKSDTIDLRNLF